ncbi:hypothetical protein TrLO_g10451 [Triparma laevis f. longispina]|uniref:Uncharacterized protein n=1 Tax=Triparma laevis f. longispina TaxID=1714387 RepID=A0A9W7F4K6_9STRA|nr:hypothetical protein TrLO_g10451 [Triparma laevis f. longispina]
MDSSEPVRRSYTVGQTTKTKKKKSQKSHVSDTTHLSPGELALHSFKSIFAVPYMSRHRNLHINLAIFMCFINIILHSLVLAHDLTIASLPYFTMSLSITYNSYVILTHDLTFGALRYIVGGDECDPLPQLHSLTDPQCSSSLTELTCKGFYIDENESHHLGALCNTCAPGLNNSYTLFIVHASLHLLTMYLLFKRLDIRTDSPFTKQFTMLVSLASALAANESVKFNDACMNAAKQTHNAAFDNFTVTLQEGYCMDATRFSMLYSYVLFLGIMTTSSVPKKERKEAQSQIKGMAQLKKSGANFMVKVNSTDFGSLARQKKEESLKFAKELKAKSKKVYVENKASNKTSNSRASTKFDSPYKYDAVQAFS